MPRTVISQVAVPSPRLLRFLRNQTECFVTSSPSLRPSGVEWSHSRHIRGFSSRPQHELKLLPPPRPQPGEQAHAVRNPVFTKPTDTSYPHGLATPTLSGSSNSPRNRRHSFGDVNRS